MLLNRENTSEVASENKRKWCFLLHCLYQILFGHSESLLSWDQLLAYFCIIAAFPFSWGRLGFQLSCNCFMWKTNTVSNRIWGAFLRARKKSARLHLGTDIWLLLGLKKLPPKFLPCSFSTGWIHCLPTLTPVTGRGASVTIATRFFSSCKTNSELLDVLKTSPHLSTLKTCTVISSQYSTAALCLCAKLWGRKPIFLEEITTETGNLISYSKHVTEVLHEKRTLHTWFLFSDWIFHNSYY